MKALQILRVTEPGMSDDVKIAGVYENLPADIEHVVLGYASEYLKDHNSSDFAEYVWRALERDGTPSLPFTMNDVKV